MKYSKRKDKYCSDVLNDNFREIDTRLSDLERGGGSTGGTSDYEELSNKPKINNVELTGNKTASELGLQPSGSYLTTNDVVDSLSAVSSSTASGKPVGALAVKELNNNLGGLRFGTNGDGSCGYYKADGSFVPFKSGFALEDLEVEFQILKHESEAPVQYTSSKKIVCVIVAGGTNTTHTDNRVSIGTPDNVVNNHVSLTLDVAEYSYSISFRAYATYMNLILLTEK